MGKEVAWLVLCSWMSCCAGWRHQCPQDPGQFTVHSRELFQQCHPESMSISPQIFSSREHFSPYCGPALTSSLPHVLPLTSISNYLIKLLFFESLAVIMASLMMTSSATWNHVKTHIQKYTFQCCSNSVLTIKRILELNREQFGNYWQRLAVLISKNI